MGFHYRLATTDGEVFGDGEWAYQPQTGDELYISGNRKVRVLRYVPAEKMAEFIDGALYGLLEVQRL